MKKRLSKLLPLPGIATLFFSLLFSPPPAIRYIYRTRRLLFLSGPFSHRRPLPHPTTNPRHTHVKFHPDLPCCVEAPITSTCLFVAPGE